MIRFLNLCHMEGRIKSSTCSSFCYVLLNLWFFNFIFLFLKGYDMYKYFLGIVLTSLRDCRFARMSSLRCGIVASLGCPHFVAGLSLRYMIYPKIVFKETFLLRKNRYSLVSIFVSLMKLKRSYIKTTIIWIWLTLPNLVTIFLAPFFKDEILIVMEATGIYHLNLLSYLLE